MRGRGRRGPLVALALLTVLWATASTAGARPVPAAQLGKLPSFPRARGVVPVLGSQSQREAHAALVKGAFAEARAAYRRGRAAGATPVPGEGSLTECVSEAEAQLSFFTQQVCYRGGPVLRDPKIHLIFWQGHVAGSGKEKSVQKFPAGYVEAIERYFADVAHDSGLLTNDFAVDSEYFSEEGGVQVPGEYALRFKTAAEVGGGEPYSYLDTTDAFPEHTLTECPGPTVTSGGAAQTEVGPCLLDADLHKEVEAAASAEGWSLETVQETSPLASNMFVVITPPGVGGCFHDESSECAYTSYCAYHSDFRGDGETIGGQSVYEDIPYIGGVEGCQLFDVHPVNVTGADAATDTLNHETNEAITDPIGSQCNEVAGKIVGCEPLSWLDDAGQEVADKCLPPETPFGEVYGEPLGSLTGTVGGDYNEVIDGDHYWTQRIWSRAASTGGGCVQRPIRAAFSEPVGAKATVPTTFSGAESGEAADPATYWVWNFGDGVQYGTTEVNSSHTYAVAGAYLVRLTVFDAAGNSHTVAHIVTVGAAPPPVPSPTSTTTTTTTTTTVTASALRTRYSVAKLAKLLGLPHSGAKLSGVGNLSLGHAQCPPACGVSVTLLASTREGKRFKHLKIGSLSTKIANKGTGAIALKLTKQGLALLHEKHTLAVELTVTVEDAEGASWKIERPLTLTSAGKAARRAVAGRQRQSLPRRGSRAGTPATGG
jgi:PKD repeat protein